MDLKTAQDATRIAFRELDRLAGIPMPKSVGDAIDSNWSELGKDGLAKLIGFLPPSERRKWDAKLIRIEDANDILAQLEDTLAAEYSNSPGELVYQRAAALIAKFQFIIGHAGEFLLVSEAILEAYGGLLGQGSSAAVDLLKLWFEGKVFGEDEDEEIRAWADRYFADTVDTMAVPLVDAIETVVAGAIIQFLQAFLTVGGIAALVQPVRMALNTSYAVAQGNALPNSGGPTFRRHKDARGK